MAATVSIRVYTGTTAATESAAQTGISFLSTDSAATDLGTRQANPITVNTNSYEKWIKARLDVVAANAVGNFLIWGDGAVQANTTLYWGTTATGATPVATTSTVATTNFNTLTSGAKGTWHSGNLTNSVGQTTNYSVFQLAVGASATPGNWTQETINYSYEES